MTGHTCIKPGTHIRVFTRNGATEKIGLVKYSELAPMSAFRRATSHDVARQRVLSPAGANFDPVAPKREGN